MKKTFGFLLAGFIMTNCFPYAYSTNVTNVKEFGEEFGVEADDTLGIGKTNYLFTDRNNNHWLGVASNGEDTAGVGAGAGYIRAVTDTGSFVSGSVQQFDTELGLEAGDGFGVGGINYLFKDTNDNHWLGGAAHGEDTAGVDAGAGYIRAVTDTGSFVSGSLQQFDIELSLEAGDKFGVNGIKYLFKDSKNNYRLGGSADEEDTAGVDAGAGYIRAVTDTGIFVSGSVQQFDTELGLETGDAFGVGGINFLFKDTNNNHWLGAGASEEDTAGVDAGAGYIRAVTDTGSFVSGSLQQFDTELSLDAGDLFGFRGINYLFNDTNNNHWLGAGAHKEDTAGIDAGAGYIRAVTDTGSFVSGSLQQFDTELSLEAGDFFGRGGIDYLFYKNETHWIGSAAPREDNGGANAGAGYIWGLNNDGTLISGSVQQFDTELSLQAGGLFGWGGISYLFNNNNNEDWFSANSFSNDTISNNGGLVYMFSIGICGDGNVQGSEVCDDGNTLDGDGCSATCSVEPGFSCQGEPSSCNVSNCEGGFTGTGESKVCVELGDIVLNPICNLDFGAFNQQPVVQTNTGTMDCEISVKDHKGISPWYVTLDFGDMAPQGALAGTPDINSANLSMFQSSGFALGLSGSVINPHVTTIDHVYNNSHFDGSTIQNVLQRTITGDQLGIYGTEPSFQLVIPAYTVAATYKGTITATLIEE